MSWFEDGIELFSYSDQIRTMEAWGDLIENLGFDQNRSVRERTEIMMRERKEVCNDLHTIFRFSFLFYFIFGFVEWGILIFDILWNNILKTLFSPSPSLLCVCLRKHGSWIGKKKWLFMLLSKAAVLRVWLVWAFVFFGIKQ